MKPRNNSLTDNPKLKSAKNIRNSNSATKKLSEHKNLRLEDQSATISNKNKTLENLNTNDRKNSDSMKIESRKKYDTKKQKISDRGLKNMAISDEKHKFLNSKNDLQNSQGEYKIAYNQNKGEKILKNECVYDKEICTNDLSYEGVIKTNATMKNHEKNNFIQYDCDYYKEKEVSTALRKDKRTKTVTTCAIDFDTKINYMLNKLKILKGCFLKDDDKRRLQECNFKINRINGKYLFKKEYGYKTKKELNDIWNDLLSNKVKDKFNKIAKKQNRLLYNDMLKNKWAKDNNSKN